MIRPGHPIRVAGLLSRLPDGADMPECLLVKGPREGARYILPGGHVEPGELPRAALVREFGEELGIAIDPPRKPVLIAPLRRRDGTSALTLVFEVTATTVDVICPNEEIADWRWVAYDAVAELMPPLERDRWFEVLILGPARQTIYLEQDDREGAAAP
jgi:8-oxo-dGTP pyrophosphatase MutT (NUDIX family)